MYDIFSSNDNFQYIQSLIFVSWHMKWAEVLITVSLISLSHAFITVHNRTNISLYIGIFFFLPRKLSLFCYYVWKKVLFPAFFGQTLQPKRIIWETIKFFLFKWEIVKSTKLISLLFLLMYSILYSCKKSIALFKLKRDQNGWGKNILWIITHIKCTSFWIDRMEMTTDFLIHFFNFKNGRLKNTLIQ